MWKNKEQVLIRLKKSWGCGNYLLRITGPFRADFFGLTIDDVTAKFRIANDQFWKNAEIETPLKQRPKRKKRT